MRSSIEETIAQVMAEARGMPKHAAIAKTSSRSEQLRKLAAVLSETSKSKLTFETLYAVKERLYG